MTVTLALLGWVLAAALAVSGLRRGRRLELVARADHELRGPVCALALAVESLGRHPELRRRAAALDAQLDRLRLGLADLEAARAGRRAAPRAADVRVDGVARAVTDAWQPAVAARGGQLSFEWRPGPTVVRADPARLSQALGNVLANAVEHGGERIAVVGERRGDGVLIAVRDSGRPPAVAGRGTPAEAVADEGAPGSARGRGLTIAADALEEADGTLAAPGLIAAPGRRRSGSAGRALASARGRGRRAGGELLGTPGRSMDPRETEVRIELPAAD